jgi:hydrogenase nickel incorporation protein HypA/HybF
VHELAIAANILDIVRAHVPPGQEAEVRAVRLRVGSLSGVVPECLAFNFGALVHGTSLAQAQLVVDSAPGAGRCRACDASFDAALPPWSCPACGAPDVEVQGGDELRVTAIELGDAPVGSGGS